MVSVAKIQHFLHDSKYYILFFSLFLPFSLFFPLKVVILPNKFLVNKLIPNQYETD